MLTNHALSEYKISKDKKQGAKWRDFGISEIVSHIDAQHLKKTHNYPLVASFYLTRM